MILFNLILPIISAIASLFSNNLVTRIIILLSSMALVINNILLFSKPGTFVLIKVLSSYEIALKIEPLAIIFALMVSILYCATNFYSFAYLSVQEHDNLGQDLNPRLHFFFFSAR